MSRNIVALDWPKRQSKSCQTLVLTGLPLGEMLLSDYPGHRGIKIVDRVFKPDGIVTNDETGSPSLDKKLQEAREILGAAYPNSREGFLDSHLEILEFIFQKGQSSMNDLAGYFEQKPNYIHVRLLNLFNASILSREKQSRGINPKGRKITEFVYSVNQEWPKPEAIQGEQVHDISNHSTQENQKMPKIYFTQEGEPVNHSTTLNLPQLPDYDPTWPQEFKDEWIRAYRHLVELQALKSEKPE